MKLVCDCGNENEFSTIDEDTREQTPIEEDGQFATIKAFRFWESHDVVGVVCEKCDKSLWLFT